MSLSACVVTRNHEAGIERAIGSIRELATEVVVADTGSTDRTVEMAGKFGARVVAVRWEDDFAAACNAALEAATGEWIFWLNPDEYLDPAGVPAVRSGIATPTAFALHLPVQSQYRPDATLSGTAGWQARVYRRDPAVRYRGRLHPSFVTPLEQLAAARGQSVGLCRATIHKRAYLSTVTPDKLRWAVRLLEAELRDRPGQLPYLIEYGRHLLWLNDPRGHDVLAEAADQVLAARDAPAAPHPDVGQLLEYLLSVAPDQSRSRIGRDEARALAARWFPDTPPVVWAAAQERFAAGDHPAAAVLLTRLLEFGRTGAFHPGGGFDPEIVGPAARLNLGICHVRAGDWAAAKAALGPLLSDPAYREQALRLYGHAERLGKPPEGTT